MCKEKTKLDALFICLTPLQIIIALKIIEVKKIKSYAVLGSFVDTPKHQFYFNRIAENACWSKKIHPDNSLMGFSLLFSVKKYRKEISTELKKFYINSIYLASISDRHVQAFVYNLSFQSLYTFDDGLANIHPHSHYYDDDNIRGYKKLIWNCIDKKYSTSELRKLSRKHFTIFHGKSNIIKNVEFLDLFSSQGNDQNRAGEINILLGQPLTEVNPKCDSEFILQTVNKLNIQYYFPHPRENYTFPNNIEIIHSPLIFEEYVLDLYKHSTYQTINVYSFFSTVLLNLSNTSFTKLYCIESNLIPKSIYQTIKDHNNGKITFISI